jgi:hypothetical protein
MKCQIRESTLSNLRVSYTPVRSACNAVASFDTAYVSDTVGNDAAADAADATHADIKDEGDLRLKTTLRVVVDRYNLSMHFSPISSLIFRGIDPQ